MLKKSIYSSKCYQIRNQDFAKMGETKSKFIIAQKLSDLGSVVNKLIQLKRVTDGGIVTKYVVTVD